jgi:hypothetical protein
VLHPGFEPGLPRPQRGVLTTRLMEQCICVKFLNLWRCRVSIPVPRACKARALPIELHPQFTFFILIHNIVEKKKNTYILKEDRKKKKNLSGPKRESNPRPLGPKPRIMPLDHWAIFVYIYLNIFTGSENRTRDLLRVKQSS